jgi:hypothetical protein
MFFDDIIFIYIVFYFKNYQKKYFLNFAFFLHFFWHDVICGHSLVGSHACGHSLVGSHARIYHLHEIWFFGTFSQILASTVIASH